MSETREKTITNLEVESLLLVLVLYNLIVGTVFELYAWHVWPCIQSRLRMSPD